MTAIPQDALHSWRKKAYDRFVMLGIPKAKQESFYYLPLSQLTLPAHALLPSIDPSLINGQILPECRASYLVFADGFFLPEMSCIPKELVSLPLDVALQRYGLFLQNRWTKTFKEESDPFSALNAAFHGRGAFVYVPPQVQCKNPLQILHLSTKGALAAPRMQIALGKQASLTVIQTLFAIGSCCFCNHAIDLSLDAGSHARFFDVQQLPSASRSFLSLRATVKRDARFEVVHITDGAEVARCSASVELAEENSFTSLQSLSLLTNTRQSHFHAFVDHAAPLTTSHQHIKMALNESSRSSFEGKIFVRPVAQKTQGYQLNNNLLLSDTATAYAKPGLEIFADDVKASHGATFAKLCDEELFYLRSRGVSRARARSLLAEGFCRELIDKIEIDSLKPFLAKAMTRVL